MRRFYWGVLFSGVFHVTLFAAPAFLAFEPPSVPVTAGPSSIRVVFLEPKKKEITQPISKPIEISEKKEREKLKEEISVIEQPKQVEVQEKIEVIPFVSVESSGAQKNEAEYAYNPAPRYPRVALLRNIQGGLILSVEVSANGEPLEIRVEKSSGYSILDEAAVEAVRKWQFIPAKIGTIAIRSQVRIPVQFKIVSR
jgi:protein TonB